jgi:hypothetical protein
MSSGRFATAFALAAALMACHTTREPWPVAIPPALSRAQVRDAVMVALHSAREGRGWKFNEWRIDSDRPGLVLAHLGVEKHWVSVSVDYSGKSVVTQILQTRGNDEREDPYWAVTWQTHLEDRIAEELKWSARTPQQP